MKKKLLGILFCVLLIAAAVLPAAGTMNEYKSQYEKQELIFGNSHSNLELADDDGVFEVGVHWISDFKPPCNHDDLPMTDDDAMSLYNILTSGGWTGRYTWGDGNAWEQDWKREDLGGTYDDWVDAVDIAYVASHGGWATDSYYGRELSTLCLTEPDDCDVSPGDAHNAWGTQDLEWVGIACCQVLRNNGLEYWANVFNGLHLVCGSIDNFADVNNGLYWGLLMTGFNSLIQERTITQAWFTSMDILQPQGRRQRILAETPDNYNDYLHGHGYVSPDPTPDSTKWFMDHSAGCEPPLQVPSGLSEIMLYKVDNRTVDEGYVGSLGGIFDLSGDVYSDDDFYYLGDGEGRILQVDRVTGIYFYHDLNYLWSPSEIPQNLPNDNESASIAQEFLNDYGLLPEDGIFYEVITEGMTEFDSSLDRKDDLSERIIETQDLVQQAVFSRHLMSGDDAFSVMGPGAKLKVYIGDYGSIIGVQGGWRDVSPENQISIMTSNEAWSLFEEYGSKVCLASLPNYDDIEVIQTTLGYWEKSLGLEQTYLIPMYIFTVNFILGGEILTDYVFIPASEDFIPPVAEITSPEDGFETDPDTPIEFTGTASYGSPSYTYSWESSIDGYLGEGETIVVTLSPGDREGINVPHTITLTVTDSEEEIGEDTIAVHVLGNQPPSTPIIEGPISGDQDKEYEYEFTSTDPEDDDIAEYQINWGDGPDIIIAGPFLSGVPLIEPHIWENPGTYLIKAKARDINGAESDWGELQVTMPRDKFVNRPFLNFLQNHPNMFPILQNLLQRLGLQ